MTLERNLLALRPGQWRERARALPRRNSSSAAAEVCPAVILEIAAGRMQLSLWVAVGWVIKACEGRGGGIVMPGNGIPGGQAYALTARLPACLCNSWYLKTRISWTFLRCIAKLQQTICKGENSNLAPLSVGAADIPELCVCLMWGLQGKAHHGVDWSSCFEQRTVGGSGLMGECLKSASGFSWPTTNFMVCLDRIWRRVSPLRSKILPRWASTWLQARFFTEVADGYYCVHRLDDPWMSVFSWCGLSSPCNVMPKIKLQIRILPFIMNSLSGLKRTTYTHQEFSSSAAIWG